MSDNAVLSQGVGYAVVLGIGLFFSALMVGITWIQNRYSSYRTSSAAEYTSASHSVKPGLIASGIVSAWTWAATLLQSSAVAYKFGISGPWWYAAGAGVQVLLFAQNAAKLKMNSPNARTFTEVIRARWGTAAHFTFMFFGLATNILVSAMLMTGGAATVTDLTGMSTHAACMLIPVGVVIYVLVGGMRASLLADYIHTSFLFAIILTFMFTVYATSPLIGSPAKMYDMLVEAAERNPVKDNADGSYLTMRSKSGLIFGVINLIGNYGTVFLDQTYWQRAIASQPVSCVKAFMLGGSAWLAIPLGFATTMGLSAVVLTTSPTFPGFPAPLTAAQVGAGLPAPSAATALLGKGGAALMLILLFLAVTSAASAELVAVSSLFTFDVYVPYINPTATERQILAVDHIAIVVWGVVMGLLGVIFFEAGISMGWLYEFMGVIIGGGVAPVALAIMSSKANKWACISAPWIGLASGLLAWLVTAATLNNGEITIETTFQDYPMLAGNLASLGVSAIVSVGASFLWPENYDWVETRALHAQEHDTPAPAAVDEKTETAIADADSKDEKTESPTAAEGQLMSARASINEDQPEYDENKDPVKLRKAFRLAVYSSLFLAVVLLLLVPLPLFFSSHIYSKAGFYVWVIVPFLWVFYGTFAVVVYPIYESRAALGHIFRSMKDDMSGKRKRVMAEQAGEKVAE